MRLPVYSNLLVYWCEITLQSWKHTRMSVLTWILVPQNKGKCWCISDIEFKWNALWKYVTRAQFTWRWMTVSLGLWHIISAGSLEPPPPPNDIVNAEFRKIKKPFCILIMSWKASCPYIYKWWEYGLFWNDPLTWTWTLYIIHIKIKSQTSQTTWTTSIHIQIAWKSTAFAVGVSFNADALYMLCLCDFWRGKLLISDDMSMLCENKKFKKSKHMAPKSVGPVGYATSAIWLIRHWESTGA
jgi:hypothetical protein